VVLRRKPCAQCQPRRSARCRRAAPHPARAPPPRPSSSPSPAPRCAAPRAEQEARAGRGQWLQWPRPKMAQMAATDARALCRRGRSGSGGQGRRSWAPRPCGCFSSRSSRTRRSASSPRYWARLSFLAPVLPLEPFTTSRRAARPLARGASAPPPAGRRDAGRATPGPPAAGAERGGGTAPRGAPRARRPPRGAARAAARVRGRGARRARRVRRALRRARCARGPWLPRAARRLARPLPRPRRPPAVRPCPPPPEWLQARQLPRECAPGVRARGRRRPWSDAERGGWRAWSHSGRRGCWTRR
jgi:hypothetical protein